jgi:YegS/Rv2252/BmrU family lipid kinase
VFIFANPIAGRGRGRAIAEQVAAMLSAEGFRPHLFFGSAGEVPSDQIECPAIAAIVIGGDGTIRGVAKRLYADISRTGIDHTPLLIVPLGTANLLGRHLGIRWDPLTLTDQVLAALRARQIVRLDVADANGELFLLMAGIGLDAQIIHELNRIRSGPIQLASYLLPAARGFASYAYPPLTVIADGQVILQSRPAIAFVGNVKEYGTGFPMLPHALPDDGLLDVCVLPCRTRLDALKLLVAAALGRHHLTSGALYIKATQVRIESEAPAPIQIDGEAAGHTPLDIRLLPVRIPFIVANP